MIKFLDDFFKSFIVDEKKEIEDYYGESHDLMELEWRMKQVDKKLAPFQIARYY